jgi:integrase
LRFCRERRTIPHKPSYYGLAGSRAKGKGPHQAAQEGKLAGKTETLARVPLQEAFDRYLKERELEISNARHEWDCSKLLRAFLHGKRLNQITADDIRAYQAHRIGQGKKPKTVNLEVGLLLRLLKRAKLRHLVADDVRSLTVVREPREMLTQAEKEHLFKTAATNPSWQTAYCAALLTVNTSMRPKELRRLLWRDLEPFSRIITVRRSKTEAGTRVIPLNDQAWAAVTTLKQSADTLGIYAPEHYIFYRQWPKIDPARPLGSWRKAWRSLRRAAGIPTFRFYDLRHQFVTELNEAGVPEGVIRELAGHVDPAMMRIYSHPRWPRKGPPWKRSRLSEWRPFRRVMAQTMSQRHFRVACNKAKLLKKMVGAPRFELGTSWSRTKRATRLRYAPTSSVVSD